MSDLAPGLLIASPGMADPRFAKSVILLAESGEEGSLGFVINKRSPYTFGELAEELGIEPHAQHVDGPVHYGGPVSPERGWIVFNGDDEVPLGLEPGSIVPVGDSLRVSATVEMLGSLLERGPGGPFKLCLGYAGWDAGQLEDELAEGSWLPLDLAPEIIFEVPEDEMWEEAIRRLGLVPGGFFMTGGGGAKA